MPRRMSASAILSTRFQSVFRLRPLARVDRTVELLPLRLGCFAATNDPPRLSSPRVHNDQHPPFHLSYRDPTAFVLARVFIWTLQVGDSKDFDYVFERDAMI